jgi:hypothetical protein
MSVHLCPKCGGQGCVSIPPDVAGDQQTFVSSGTGPWPCRICGGAGILWDPKPAEVSLRIEPREAPTEAEIIQRLARIEGIQEELRKDFEDLRNPKYGPLRVPTVDVDEVRQSLLDAAEVRRKLEADREGLRIPISSEVGCLWCPFCGEYPMVFREMNSSVARVQHGITEGCPLSGFTCEVSEWQRRVE